MDWDGLAVTFKGIGCIAAQVLLIDSIAKVHFIHGWIDGHWPAPIQLGEQEYIAHWVNSNTESSCGATAVSNIHFILRSMWALSQFCPVCCGGVGQINS